MHMQLIEVQHDTVAYNDLIAVAEQLGQAKYIVAPMNYADESVLIGAYVDGLCVGFLRLLIEIIGSDAGRPPIMHAGSALVEGYV